MEPTGVLKQNVLRDLELSEENLLSITEPCNKEFGKKYTKFYG